MRKPPRADRADPAVLVAALRTARVAFDPGLSDLEVAAAEEVLGAPFGRAHRAFLQTALPVGPGWPNWRRLKTPALRRQLAAPLDGVRDDIRADAYWERPWGPRPDDPDERLAIAEQFLQRWPVLAPLVGHRYVSTAPHDVGIPVLSVVQTDVVPYGDDLIDWAVQEFRVVLPQMRNDPREQLPPFEALTSWARLALGPLIDGAWDISRGEFIAWFGEDPLVLPDVEVIGDAPGDQDRLVAAIQASGIAELRFPTGEGEPIAMLPAPGLLVNSWPGESWMMDIDLRELGLWNDPDLLDPEYDRRWDVLRVFLRFIADTLGKPVFVVPEGHRAGEEVAYLVEPLGPAGPPGSERTPS